MARRRFKLFRGLRLQYNLLVRVVVLGVVGWLGYNLYEASLKPVRVGIFFPTSGPAALEGRVARDSVLLALKELENSVGLLHRPVDVITVNPGLQADMRIAQMRSLLEEEGADVVFACLTAACLRELEPVANASNGLIVYPFADIGLDGGSHTMTTGSLPNQLLLPPMGWAAERFGKRFYLVASDSLYGRVAREVVRHEVKRLEGEVVGEIFLDQDFSDGTNAANELLRAAPDVVLNVVVGDANVALYKALHAAGAGNGQIPTLFFNNAGRLGFESIGWEAVAGNFSVSFYDADNRTEVNRQFIKAFKRQFGNSEMPGPWSESAYASVMVWASAVKRARSTNATAVEAQIEGTVVEVPSGRLEIARGSHYPVRQPLVAEISSSGVIATVWRAETAVEPHNNAIAMPRADWDRFLDDLYRSWGDNWEKPGR
jgi:urea transport system substrate-binding protein